MYGLVVRYQSEMFSFRLVVCSCSMVVWYFLADGLFGITLILLYLYFVDWVLVHGGYFTIFPHG